MAILPSNRQTDPALTLSRRDRLLIIFSTPLLMYWIVSGIVAVQNLSEKVRVQDHKSPVVMDVLEALFIEMLVAFGLFCEVMFIVALFAPRWANRLATFFGKHAWQAILVFGGGCGVVVALIAITER